ncbi:MAG: Rrf2 family transcriptional regulator [Candidatus Omnitrophica bacterium]|nr:Rrf2 family transcriptional regulator [Candidatus Omnitrophota bacterium]
MKLSTKGRYGSRLMLDLARHQARGPVLLRDIAGRQSISEKYLWQLIPPLKRAGLVNSTRGAHGGYRLARQPKEITLYDIIVELEGPLNLVDCVDQPDQCEQFDLCVTREVWHELARVMKEKLQNITLADLLERYHNRLNALSYSI